VDKYRQHCHNKQMTIEYKKLTVRRREILGLACELTKERHYNTIKRSDLAELGKTSTGNVSRIMGGMDEFKNHLIQYAVKHDHHSVIAQAISENHPLIQGFSNSKKKRHLVAAI